jgi:hypothetical protein
MQMEAPVLGPAIAPPPAPRPPAKPVVAKAPVNKSKLVVPPPLPKPVPEPRVVKAPPPVEEPEAEPHGLLDATVSGSTLVGGGDFGPEASLAAVVAGVLLTTVYMRLAYRRGTVVPRRRRSTANLAP